jgi:2-oxoglutarate dehydrogenase E1 component
MGAWTFMEPRLRELLPAGVALRYAGRPDRASPAEGYPAAHAQEQQRIVEDAMTSGERRTTSSERRTTGS